MSGRARMATNGPTLDAFAAIRAVLVWFTGAQVFAVCLAVAVDAKRHSVISYKPEVDELCERFNVVSLNIPFGSARFARPVVAPENGFAPLFKPRTILNPSVSGASVLVVGGILPDHETVGACPGAESSDGLIRVIVPTAVLADFQCTVSPALFAAKEPRAFPTKFVWPLLDGGSACVAFNCYFVGHDYSIKHLCNNSTVFWSTVPYNADIVRQRWAEQAHGEKAEWKKLTAPVG